jgi:hypothetical protein
LALLLAVAPIVTFVLVLLTYRKVVRIEEQLSRRP